jgi:hypothetical protein
MILTRWFDCAHGEVERADPANDPDKTAHGESHIRRTITRKAAWKRLCK